MTFPRRILVPTDFSPASENAIDRAVALAKAVDGYIVLLHAFEPVHGLPQAFMAAMTRATDAAEHEARQSLARAAETRQSNAVAISVVMQPGPAWRVIVSTARDDGMDLIVMATHGWMHHHDRSDLHRALVGSVTEKVVRSAPCPVLTVPSSAPNPG